MDWLYSDVALQTTPMLVSATFCQQYTEKHKSGLKYSYNEIAMWLQM